MKQASLAAAAAIVLIANAFALEHAWRNRSGPIDSDITLTERELAKSWNSGDEDSGETLRLAWRNPWFPQLEAELFDRKALQELGFDTTLAPSDRQAAEFYGRQDSRRVFVALEYDGPAWHKRNDNLKRQDEQLHGPVNANLRSQRESSTHLVAIDTSTNAAQLRARHPNRGSVIIVPAVVSISLAPGGPGFARLNGTIEDIPSEIHVPLAFSAGFRGLPRNGKARYRVHLRYGASLEPWIVGVEFLPAD
jgi:hypothetical protein